MNHETLVTAVTVANAAFTLFRSVGHVPQLVAVLRDQGGATAISVSSWVTFMLANTTNALYMLVVASDWVLCLVNGLSALSCSLIAGIAFAKQRRASAAFAAGRPPAVAG